MKGKIRIEIGNGADVGEFYDKVQKALDIVFARNLDALHDVLSEFGDGVTIIIKNGSAVPGDVKRVLEDLQRELPDFSVAFEAGDFNTKLAKEHKDTKMSTSISLDSKMNLNQLSKVVLDSAFEVRKTIGPGLLESAYEAALAYEIRQRGVAVKRQVPVQFIYKGVDLGESYRIDLLVDDRLIVECKATEANIPVYGAQCLTYLKATGLTLGLVINFGCPLLKECIERVINGHLDS